MGAYSVVFFQLFDKSECVLSEYSIQWGGEWNMGGFEKMNHGLSVNIKDCMNDILKDWQARMKDEKGERFFQYMPEEVVDRTSREFAELMTSSLSAGDEVSGEKLVEFAEKVVRFGWSIKFVNKSIEHFSDVSFEILERAHIINDSNLRVYMKTFSKWIDPLRDSIIEAYSVEWERTVSLQKIALQELSASLIPVFDKISVMPIIGTIDTERAKLIMENLLEGVVKQRAEVVLLDITGVPVVDTMVAHHIIQAADAVRLVGAKCMLVGIRPEIAQTIVTLGIDLNEFTTTSTLRRGMQDALKLTSRKVVEVETA